MIDWTRGYECQWRYSPVDVRTWASKGSTSNAVSATYTSDSATDAVETGTLSCSMPYQEGPSSGWMRIEGIVTQGDEVETVTVGTLFFETETSTWSGGRRTDNLRGTSGLYPASQADPVKDGAWAAKGENGAAHAAALIGAHTDAPVVVDGICRVPETVVFDLDSSPLEAAREILAAAGWVMRPDGDGRIHVMQAPSEPSYGFGGSERGMFLGEAARDANGRVTYTRAWGPGLRAWDMFQANLPEIGLSGTYRVVSQRVTCGSRITVEETVEEVL